MHPLSATDAINPAFARVRRLLTPRPNWGTAYKLCFLALLAIVGPSFDTNFGNSLHGAQNSALPPGFYAFLAAFGVIVAAVFFVVSLVFFYIGSRLQFVLYDLILREDTVVAPSWRMFGAITWRWLGVRFAVMLCVFLPFAPMLVPAMLRLQHASATSNNNPGAVFAVIAGMFGLLMIFSFVFAAAMAIVHDFGMPAMLFENTGFVATLRRAVEPFRTDPGQTLLYLLLRMVLSFALTIGAEIVTGIVALISLIPFAVLGGLFYLVVRNHGPAGRVLLFAGVGLLALVWVALLFVLVTALIGAVQLFLVTYGMYFLAGRYPPLGAAMLAKEPELAYPPGYRPPAVPPMPPVVPIEPLLMTPSSELPPEIS